eukprot:TRINITY_DN19945_c0_g1_i1.p1 TRINITY_DN19945_c0_g1~~TRINITY_DN19945_c0_g1_i1.p1  ORF type:complete len:582 (+),score=65.97 TRINITY_DN19945_c0_g1_i1:80-1747(+)
MRCTLYGGPLALFCCSVLLLLGTHRWCRRCWGGADQAPAATAAAAERNAAGKAPAATAAAAERRAAGKAPAATAAAERSAAGSARVHARSGEPWGLGWAEINVTAEEPGAFRRVVNRGAVDTSEALARMKSLAGLPGLLAASRPLRIYRDKASGIAVALGMMAHTITPRLCGALYQMQVMGWPVNIVGPVLEELRGRRELPVKSLRYRKDLHRLREGVPAQMRSAINQLLGSTWMLRKHFVFADMAALAPPDTLLLLVDAGDVFAQLPPSAFASAWLDWERDQGSGTIALGADYDCYPFDKGNAPTFGCGKNWEASWNLTQSPCDLVSGARGVNSGLLAGRARDITAYLGAFADFLQAVPRVCYIPEDQALSFLHYLNTRGLLSCPGCARQQSSTVRASLDVNETLFACLVWVGDHWASPEYVRTAAAPGAPFAAPGARHPPSLLHFSGTAGKRQLQEQGGQLGGRAGLWGYWGALAEGSSAEAERLAARTADSELSVDGARAKLGLHCGPPAAGAPPRVLRGWEAPLPGVELPLARRTTVRARPKVRRRPSRSE